ncbi:ABC transporter permease [Clostridium malenominatum]|uniref:ABC transporter permease n=1 Tax=Clostridium malenominatum TaxID=1539 RepID=UPI0031D8E11C
MDFWISVLEQGLIFSIMVLGVYITYKILDFPDLSVDGSFPLGASVTAAALMGGINPYIACLLSLVAGLAAGTITGLLHVKLKITNLLSGILVMIGLYSINLRVMGKANVPLFNKDNIFIEGVHPLIVIVLFVLLVKLALDFFLNTKLGFILKATGDNPQLVTSLGMDKGLIKILGLAMSNGLVALSGGMMAQYRRFSDVGMGTGIIVMGLASIIIGETIFKRISILKASAIGILGSVLYNACTAFALKLNFQTTDLKLITAVIVVIALSMNGKTLSFKPKKLLFRGGNSYVKNRESAQNI